MSVLFQAFNFILIALFYYSHCRIVQIKIVILNSKEWNGVIEHNII
jgi:hypothetical protein